MEQKDLTRQKITARTAARRKSPYAGLKRPFSGKNKTYSAQLGVGKGLGVYFGAKIKF